MENFKRWIKLKTDPCPDRFINRDTNSLWATPTHDAYLENGTYIGLTVGIYILAYVGEDVNIHKKIDFLRCKRKD